jgi:hypothetical protein
MSDTTPKELPSNSTPTEVPLDSCVRAVIDSFKARAVVGKAKYGTDLDRKDLDVLAWIQHAQEEHMDAILYLQKLKQIFQEKKEACVKGNGADESDGFMNYWGC